MQIFYIASCPFLLEITYISLRNMCCIIKCQAIYKEKTSKCRKASSEPITSPAEFLGATLRSTAKETSGSLLCSLLSRQESLSSSQRPGVSLCISPGGEGKEEPSQRTQNKLQERTSPGVSQDRNASVFWTIRQAGRANFFFPGRVQSSDLRMKVTGENSVGDTSKSTKPEQ